MIVFSPLTSDFLTRSTVTGASSSSITDAEAEITNSNSSRSARRPANSRSQSHAVVSSSSANPQYAFDAPALPSVPDIATLLSNPPLPISSQPRSPFVATPRHGRHSRDHNAYGSYSQQQANSNSAGGRAPGGGRGSRRDLGYERAEGRRHRGGATMSGDLGDVQQDRKEWVRAWMVANPGRPAPCSAKACYRLADSLYSLVVFLLLLDSLKTD